MKRILVISSSLLIAGSTLYVIASSSNSTAKEEKSSQCKRKGSWMKSHAGLQYEVLAEGTGAVAEKGKVVSVHYTGWLNDGNNAAGKKFDSSVDRGQAFQFRLGAGYVIKGWDEGVAGMKVGEKRRLYIPSALGYGARGAGAAIPPHADLIFDVELLSIG